MRKCKSDLCISNNTSYILERTHENNAFDGFIEKRSMSLVGRFDYESSVSLDYSRIDDRRESRRELEYFQIDDRRESRRELEYSQIDDRRESRRELEPDNSDKTHIPLDSTDSDETQTQFVDDLLKVIEDYSSSSSTKSEKEEEWYLSKIETSSIPKTQAETFIHKIYSKPKTFSGAFARLINNLFENPEGRMTNVQRMSILFFTAFEAYRTIISSFLIVFVPQTCGGYSCTIIQNLIPKDNLEVAAISVNTFMAVYFCVLFMIERVRETLIKKHFIADKSSPTDKEYLVKMISEMESTHRRKILRVNSVYRVFAQFLLLVFFINAGISCVVIQKNYLNNTTSTVFITNTFFMIHRIHKALKITSSGKYNIYSAYRSSNLLYNRYRGTWLKNKRWNPV